MKSTRTERGHIVSAEGNDNFDVSRDTVLTTERGDIISRNESAAVANKGDFFSMFYLPSSQSYDESVHFTTSSYSAPFQGAASAMMGGILSVLDTALAVLNEEFDNPSDSIISDSTKDENEDDLQGNVNSCVSSGRIVMACCKQASPSQISTQCKNYVAISSSNESKSSDDKTSSILENSPKQDVSLHDMSIERSGAQENDEFTPKITLIGSISTLQLYEEDTEDAMKKLLSDLHSESMNDMQIETNADAGPRSESTKNEEPEYCIIRNENETNDGWLVVCDN